MEEWLFQYSGKDKNGGMLNVRAHTAQELRENLNALFGEGSDAGVIAGFSGNFVSTAAPQASSAPAAVVAAFPGTEVVSTPAPAPVAAAPSGEGETTCPRCSVGHLKLRNGKKGRFYGCSNFPNCKFTQDA